MNEPLPDGWSIMVRERPDDDWTELIVCGPRGEAACLEVRRGSARSDVLRGFAVAMLAASRVHAPTAAQPIAGPDAASRYADLEPFTHTRSCPMLTPMSDDRCTCGLEWRIPLATERTMHAAWRKRAEEAEAREHANSSDGPDANERP